MDIVVTLPVDRGGLFHLHEKQEVPSYWSMKRQPKNLTPNDNVFICTEGQVHLYFEIDEFGWEDGEFIIYFDIWTEIKPIPMKGFQGFRYRKFDYEELSSNDAKRS